MRGMPLRALVIALAAGKNTRSFSMLDENRTRFSTYCHRVQRARKPLSQRAISLGSCTGAGDFVLQLIRLETYGSELQES